ncbi:MAG: EAL domain-containing protein, partial [Acidimicrobiia bacterium]
RSFVAGMANDAGDAIVVRSTTELAQNLGIRVVAEGVEDADVWSALTRMGCDAGQGYFLGRPVAGDALLRWLAEHPSSPALPMAGSLPRA